VTPVKHFQQRLQKAITEGAAARRALIRHVAGLPIEQLHNLSPDTLRLLGANGLVRLLEQRNADVLFGKALPPAQRPPKAPKNTLLPLLLVVGALTALGPVPEHLATALAPTSDDFRSPATETWPACPRLDHAVDGCLYTVGGGGGLSLLDAASRLGLAAEDFIDLNSHIHEPAGNALRRGSQLVVWRGKLTLKGSSE
jgi:hypothetical protein